MTMPDQITSAPSADGAYSALAANDSREVTTVRSVPQPDVVDLPAAELAARSSGEATPATAAPGSCAAKESRSAAFVFEVAAVLRGHNIATEEGRSAARRDFRVWDLYERMLP